MCEFDVVNYNKKNVISTFFADIFIIISFLTNTSVYVRIYLFFFKYIINTQHEFQ